MKKSLAALLAVWIILLLPGCLQGTAAKQQRYETQYYDVFDTYISVVGFAGSAEEFEEYDSIIYSELQRLHQLFDIYNDYTGINNIKTINDNAGIAPVEVDDSILDLLAVSIEAYETTGGAVNVAMGPVLRLWHDAREAGEDNPQAAATPGMDALREAAGYSGIDRLQLDLERKTVYLTEADAALDVGAIAKGYAAQKAMDKAVEAGFSSGILNAGGNVCVVGVPQDGRNSWNVGIQSPGLMDGVQEIYDSLQVGGPVSVVTSGDYQRYYQVDGTTYHHIIDPQTLYPADMARAVTVIHPDSTMADILSTALFILPYEQGRAVLEAQGGEALWIWKDGTTAQTDGYRTVSQNHGARR